MDMIHNNFITNFINLQDNNLEVVEVTEQNDSYIIHVHFKSIPIETCCPNCNSISFIKHGYYSRVINHIFIGDKKTLIVLKQPRLICLDCNKTFNLTTSLVDSSRRISKQLISNIIIKSKQKRSFKDIALEEDISQTTTINEFKKQIHEYRCSLTEVICIDEFKASTVAGTYALIIGDPVTGNILDVLPDRKQDYLLYYFQSIEKEEILKVKYIVTDLFEPYRSIIHSCFPNVIHIADRFHWIRQATEAFNSQRIKTMNFYSKSSENNPNKVEKQNFIEYASLLKHNYKLLLSNRTKHEAWYYDQIIKKDRLGNQFTMNQIIEKCINFDNDLEDGYHLLQKLYQIAKFSNEHTIKDNLQKWCDEVKCSDSIIPELKKAALTYQSWKNEMANSFIINPITHERMSNGFIEGKNNFCKVIKRIGFGYKDFDLFRNRIINISRSKKEKINK